MKTDQNKQRTIKNGGNGVIMGYITEQIRKAIITCLKEDRGGEVHEDDNIESTVKTIEELFMGKEQ